MREAMVAASLPPPTFFTTADAFLVEILATFEATGLSTEYTKVCQWLVSHAPASIQDLMGLSIFPSQRLTGVLRN